MLVRLAYLGMTNVFALLRMLPGSDRDKNAEILAVRHQITVLQRQLGPQKIRLGKGLRSHSWGSRRCAKSKPRCNR